MDMTTLLDAYIGTALWSSVNQDTGELCGDDYSIGDLSPALRASSIADITGFLELSKDYRVIPECDDLEKVMHDFLLNRNGHGAGFWDGDYPVHGEKLSEITHSFGNVDLYVGDDKLIYGM